MMDLFLVILLCFVLAGYYYYRNNRRKAHEVHGILCERTEDTGFYEDLDPGSLSAYQAALNTLFSVIGAPRFDGSLIPRAARSEVEMLLTSAPAPVNARYLRVMLCQYLRADHEVRRQEDLMAHWAERVYELDRQGPRGGPRGIPSAWKVYFAQSLSHPAGEAAEIFSNG